MELTKFPCDCCGLCCQSLSGVSAYADLDDGTGVCIYFDKETNLCNIYEKRPLKCNINAAYSLFQEHLSYEEYIKLNVQACQKLKGEF